MAGIANMTAVLGSPIYLPERATFSIALSSFVFIKNATPRITILTLVKALLSIGQHNASSKELPESDFRRRRNLPWLYHIFGPSAEGIFAVSHSVADKMVSVCKISHERIWVIYNPVLPVGPVVASKGSYPKPIKCAIRAFIGLRSLIRGTSGELPAHASVKLSCREKGRLSSVGEYPYGCSRRYQRAVEALPAMSFLPVRHTAVRAQNLLQSSSEEASREQAMRELQLRQASSALFESRRILVAHRKSLVGRVGSAVPSNDPGWRTSAGTCAVKHFVDAKAGLSVRANSRRHIMLLRKMRKRPKACQP